MEWTLYLVSDRMAVGETPLLDAVEAAIRGGVSVVQYREKHLSTRRMIEESSALRHLCHSYGIPLLVNDRLDVALAIDADGVHLGQDDMPPLLARQILRRDRIIGLTVHNEDELTRAIEEHVVDYVSFAPIFATPTKPDHQTPLGVERLASLVAMSTLPAVAIGGINERTIEDVARTGVDGVCVVSAILSAPDPFEAAQTLRARWNAARL